MSDDAFDQPDDPIENRDEKPDPFEPPSGDADAEQSEPNESFSEPMPSDSFDLCVGAAFRDVKPQQEIKVKQPCEVTVGLMAMVFGENPLVPSLPTVEQIPFPRSTFEKDPADNELEPSRRRAESASASAFWKCIKKISDLTKIILQSRMP